MKIIQEDTAIRNDKKKEKGPKKLKRKARRRKEKEDKRKLNNTIGENKMVT